MKSITSFVLVCAARMRQARSLLPLELWPPAFSPICDGCDTHLQWLSEGHKPGDESQQGWEQAVLCQVA